MFTAKQMIYEYNLFFQTHRDRLRRDTNKDVLVKK